MELTQRAEIIKFIGENNQAKLIPDVEQWMSNLETDLKENITGRDVKFDVDTIQYRFVHTQSDYAGIRTRITYQLTLSYKIKNVTISLERGIEIVGNGEVRSFIMHQIPSHEDVLQRGGFKS